jgi:formate hydrogenlyase transcriptional activator
VIFSTAALQLISRTQMQIAREEPKGVVLRNRAILLTGPNLGRWRWHDAVRRGWYEDGGLAHAPEIQLKAQPSRAPVYLNNVTSSPPKSVAPFQEQLANDEARLSSIFDELFDQMPEAILLLDDALRAIRANREFVRMFGHSQEEIIGRSVSSLIVPEERRDEAHGFFNSLARGQTVNVETVRIRKDGQRIDVSLVEVPLNIPSATVSSYAIYREITERRHLERELQHERDRLRLLLDLNNRVASHLDLRKIFEAVSSELRRVFNCDFVGLALPESSGRYLRQHMIDFPESKGLFKEGTLYPIEGSLSGVAFRNIKPVLLTKLSKGQHVWNSDQDFYKRITNEGPFESGCFVPLIIEARVLGVLQLTSRKEHSFSEQDLELLGQVANQIAITLNNALQYQLVSETKERLAEQMLYLEDEIRVEHNFEDIVGNSAKLKAVLENVQIVAPVDSSVLILGETGTGKELVARAIHDRSSRRGQPFVKINCAAIPSGLLESELFGHEKGAFTGAIAQKMGRFELAHKGTLFLDEVGDIPLELQPKLLRVLQEQEFERLGSNRTQHVDVRLVAATNCNLAEMVIEKKFRSDLYYRLNVFPIAVPPLRERREDIPLLVCHFANKYSRRMGRQIESIPKEAIDALRRYAWPGNIRELQNLMERAVLLSSGSTLRVPMAEILADSDGSRACDGNALDQAERELIRKALNETGWVVGGPRGAATRLGLNRTTLAYKMQKLGISRPT